MATNPADDLGWVSIACPRNSRMAFHIRTGFPDLQDPTTVTIFANMTGSVNPNLHQQGVMGAAKRPQLCLALIRWAGQVYDGKGGGEEEGNAETSLRLESC